MAGKLTPLQQEFLKQLFGPCVGNVRKAADAVGVEDYSTLMTSEMAEAIRARADNEIVMNAAKAVFVMQSILENPHTFMNMDKVTKVCTEFLDRAGLGKVDRSSGGGGLKIGLVILPNKLPIVEAEYEVIEDRSNQITVQGELPLDSPSFATPQQAQATQA